MSLRIVRFTIYKQLILDSKSLFFTVFVSIFLFTIFLFFISFVRIDFYKPALINFDNDEIYISNFSSEKLQPNQYIKFSYLSNKEVFQFETKIEKILDSKIYIKDARIASELKSKNINLLNISMFFEEKVLWKYILKI